MSQTAVAGTQSPAVEQRLRQSFDALLQGSLAQVCIVVAGLFAFFAFIDRLIYPEWAVPVIMAKDVLVAALFGAAYVAARAGQIPRNLAHPVATLLALAASAGILHDTWVLGDPSHSIYTMLVLFATGAIFLSHRYYLPVVAFNLGGWLVVTQRWPLADWQNAGLGLFAAGVLGVLVQSVRISNHERLERLRALEEERRIDLEQQEEALRDALEALGESEERYRRLIEESPDALVVHSGGRIVFVNPAAVRLFGGKRPEDVLGRDPLSFVPAEYAETIRARVHQIEVEGRKTEPLEVRLMRLDGEMIDVELMGHQVFFENKPADQTILRDITDRRRAEQARLADTQRIAEISRLKDLDHMRTQFVNTITHELRTPLTPMKVQLHLLKETDQTPERRAHALEILERNFQRLHGLLDELLEVARIQNGRLRIQQEAVDLAKTVDAAVETYADVAQENGVTLTKEVEPNLLVQGDCKRLAQVMDNLIGNALKFTGEGGHIDVQARRMGGGVVVLIRDDGDGMTPAAIEKLFEPFGQVHDPTTRQRATGTGLGLYICKGFIESHGGRIWAESEGPGLGSTFAFSLPLWGSPANTRDAAVAAKRRRDDA